MSFPDAALAAAWLLIVLLLLGFAGLRRQMLEIQRYGASGPGARAPEIGDVLLGDLAGRPTIALLISDKCPTCHEIGPTFASLANELGSTAGHAVLKPTASLDESFGDGVRVIVDPESFNRMYPGYVPALVLLDRFGQATFLEPVGAIDALKAAHAKFVEEVVRSAP